jgi:hypothetical protein
LGSTAEVGAIAHVAEFPDAFAAERPAAALAVAAVRSS